MTHTHRTRVASADLDAAGIVYYGNFLRFIEAAEDDLLRQSGASKHELFRRLGVLLARTQFFCRFRSPARPDDLLDVSIKVSGMTRKCVRCSFEIRHVPSGRLVAQGHYELTCVDSRTLVPTVIPDELRALYDAIHVRGQNS